MRPIAFILSYCKGQRIDAWADWMFEEIENQGEMAPVTGRGLLRRIKDHFGDADEGMTARIKMDQITQTGSVDDYITAFRTLAPKTGYGPEDLKHKFMMGLKEVIRSKVFSVYPPPITVEEWMEVALNFQRSWEMQRLLQSGRSKNSVGTMGSGSQSTQGSNRTISSTNANSGGGRTYPGAGQPMAIDRQVQKCEHCGRFGHSRENCRRRLGLCLKCGKGGHVARNCREQVAKVREIEVLETTACIEEVKKEPKEEKKDFVAPQ